MFCIIANFGDDSIALIQWAYEKKLKDVTVLSVDTGWQAQSWKKRLDCALQWLDSLNFKHIHLPAEHDMKKLVETRGQFPSQKFHWCAGFLKGITILNWLETHDEDYEATILLPNRRDMTKTSTDLMEYVEESERYDDRRLWYPLYQHSKHQRDELIKKTPFKTPLNHRSLECQPCIHTTSADTATFAIADITRVEKLESKTKATMFEMPFRDFFNKLSSTKEDSNAENYYNEFAKSCSWDYGCGL